MNMKLRDKCSMIPIANARNITKGPQKLVSVAEMNWWSAFTLPATDKFCQKAAQSQVWWDVAILGRLKQEDHLSL